MDLGISGRRAIICASSKGLGRACAEALLSEGVRERLNYRAEVVSVAADVTTSAGRAALADACPDPDFLINNNAGPEPYNVKRLGRPEEFGAGQNIHLDGGTYPALI